MATYPLIRFVRFSALSAVLASATLLEAYAQPPKGAASLTVEEVVQLYKGGVDEDVIVTKIKMNGKAFDLSPAEISRAQENGNQQSHRERTSGSGLQTRTAGPIGST